LSKPDADLASADEKPSRTFEVADAFLGRTARQFELFPGKRRHTQGVQEFLALITKNPKECNNVTVDVVVSLDWSRRAIEQYCGRSTKRLHIVVNTFHR